MHKISCFTCGESRIEKDAKNYTNWIEEQEEPQGFRIQMILYICGECREEENYGEEIGKMKIRDLAF